MADNARGVHVSPGIYTREIDMTYAIRSLGITTLGVVGETLRGPAFQPMDISNWREFQETFGGTSTEKFKGSQYPKYELPYIAKSYLSESEQLKVVRVLGISGYNAGPAWLVTAQKGNNGKKVAVAVIRSRGSYNPYIANNNSGYTCICEPTKYDSLRYFVGEKTPDSVATDCNKQGYNEKALQIKPFIPLDGSGNECDEYYIEKGDSSWNVSQTNRGRFKLIGVTGAHTEDEINTIIRKATATTSSSNDRQDAFAEGYFEYAISLNPYDKEYIFNVLGSKAYDGNAPIFVESLYDVALEQAIANAEVDRISSALTFYDAYNTADYCHHEPIYGIAEKPMSSLNRKYVGRRYLASKDSVDASLRCVLYDYEKGTPLSIHDAKDIGTDVYGKRVNTAESGKEETTVAEFAMKVGQIYTVRQYTTQDGKRHYYYAAYTKESVDKVLSGEKNVATTNYYGNLLGGGYGGNKNNIGSTLVFNNADGLYYRMYKAYLYEDTDGNSYVGKYSYCEYSGKTDFTVEEKDARKFKGIITGGTIDPMIERLDVKSHSTDDYYWYTSNNVKCFVVKNGSSYIKINYGVTIESGNIRAFDDLVYINAQDKKAYKYDGSTLVEDADASEKVFEDSSTETLYVITSNKKNIFNNTDTKLAYKVVEGINLEELPKSDFNLYKIGNTTANPVIMQYSSKGLENFKMSYYYAYENSCSTPKRVYKYDSTNNLSAITLKEVSDNDIDYVALDMNDYKSAFRYASTPWIVSNLKGDFEHVELTKLFRFHTISDGDNANYEVKVSIENIRPDEGTFDVVVRRVDDLDESIIPLEKFGRCTMVPGDSNYIAYKIGSFDGVYESKSKYITVEVNDTTAARTSVPAGFLGYPIPMYDGTPISGDAKTNVSFPTIKYNRFFDEEVKNRKQYFGLSSWVGVDIDNFTFKGTKAYINDPRFLSHGFHLDSRIDNEARKNDNTFTLTVDGELGYEFDCVSNNSRTQILDQPPIIGKEVDMYGSIYEYVNLRKFTVFFYGGFDGWDVYRDERTNTDNFKMSQYRGYINKESGEGYSFNRIKDPEALGLNQNGITSDWYAYLAGIRQFANPEATDINVFATPGIDYVNQKLLVQEAIEMIEEERADSIYVITTPDKPSGAGDFVDEMYTPEDAVYNLEDTEIDSNYSCTYYPWVKYLDVENNQYIYLPPTKDVVRNFAQTDNVSYPWFAPAGVNRGQVDCVRAHFITKLADEDTLYDGRINPVKTFAQDGPKIWGQKNLQINESQLNRIAVRRLLLRMRKLIAIACIGLIFEPNDATAKQSFISTVTPILDGIRSNRGISDYRIEVNDTVESRERRELPVKIYFKPYNALEYITIDFVLTPEGVDFSDI